MVLSVDPLIAGVELGGTKCIAVLARGDQIVASERFPTRTPEETLPAIRDQLEAWYRETPFAVLGIASFGPVHLDRRNPEFGRIGATPKAGWSGADVFRIFADRLPVPVAIDTDVGGAALAEARWGGARGCSSHVYVTVGTGIGAGIVIDGAVIHGVQHPEVGHIRVRRDPLDTFAGSCPFHGDCLEGLASGPAIAARAGDSADRLSHDDPVWARVAAELGEMTVFLILAYSPERIVFGGGVVVGQPDLIERVGATAANCLGDYLPAFDRDALRSRVIVSPLAASAGSLGAIALGLLALAESDPSKLLDDHR